MTKKNRVLKGISLFSGIDALGMGIKRLGIDVDWVNYCEIDEHASRCYSILHNEPESKNLWDITKIKEDELDDFDLLLHSSPCQSVSRNGKGSGANKGSGTRSSLMWDSVRIIKAKKPKYIVWENVKGMVSKNHIHNLEEYIEELSDIGYKSYWKILNSKNFNIPQNRERVFVVSILDSQDDFVFPEPMELTTTLKELSYFRKIDDITHSFENYYSENIDSNKSFADYFEGLNTGRTGVKNLKMYNYDQLNRVTIIDYDNKVLSPTLSCRGVQNYCIKFYSDGRIYKPSPRMCFRLMGFTDDEFNKIKDIGTDSQLWDRAGNSIVVDVAEGLFKELLKDYMN